METALQLICPRVAVGRADEMLADVADRIVTAGAHYLVVIDEAKKFSGMIRLMDLAWRANPGTRILADLVAPIRPVPVKPHESAAAVVLQFEQYRLPEAVILAEGGIYLGLITHQSVLEWSLQELRRTRIQLSRGEESLQLAEKSARAAAAAQEALLARLSHALRAPLSPMLLISSTRAASPDLPEALRADFQTIAQHAATEARLIQEMIDAARPGKNTSGPSGRTNPPFP